MLRLAPLHCTALLCSAGRAASYTIACHTLLSLVLPWPLCPTKAGRADTNLLIEAPVHHQVFLLVGGAETRTIQACRSPNSSPLFSKWAHHLPDCHGTPISGVLLEAAAGEVLEWLRTASWMGSIVGVLRDWVIPRWHDDMRHELHAILPITG